MPARHISAGRYGFAVNRQPGTQIVSLSRKGNTISFYNKDEVAAVFEALYDSLYQSKDATNEPQR